ncbi:hypothetical protein LSH36_94g01031, partial [Paralvinella palmiformis]
GLFHFCCSDDYVVRVKAQVMTRDDSTGGWVPMGGGGMSIVGLRKLVISTGDDIHHEYLIHGERIADQSVVLNCVLKKDVQYTKANPTFHHWKTEEKRFGLTFQSSADARAFDKGVKRAVEDLLEAQLMVFVALVVEFVALVMVFVAQNMVFVTQNLVFVGQVAVFYSSRSWCMWPNVMVFVAQHRNVIGPKSCCLYPSSPESNDLEVGDDEVFMTLELPLVSRKDSSSQSASTASTTTSSPSPQSPALSSPTIHPEAYNPGSPHVLSHPHNNHHHLHRVHYISKSRPSQPTSPNNSQRSVSVKSSTESGGIVGGLRDDVWLKPDSSNELSDKIKSDDSATLNDNVEIVDNSYVQFENRPSAHEYSYPTIDSIGKGTTMGTPGGHHMAPPPPQSVGMRRDSISSLKKHQLDVLQPPLPTKSKRKKRHWLRKDKRQSRHLLSQRSRCVYCHEMFVHEENQRGACEDAPDRVALCIERVSCICCARGMLYHCMADSDGDYGHPCVCDTSDDSNCKKWTALAVLSLFVPCLWCYWPLSTCHRCGVACGCCGGRHKAA